MGLLTFSNLDLASPVDQASAISTIMREMNRYNIDNDVQNQILVSNFGIINVTIPANSTGVFTNSAVHGLGFKPMFSGTAHVPTANPPVDTDLPVVQFVVNRPLFTHYLYCDTKNIYYNAYSFSMNPNPAILSAYYIIYNLPMPS